MSEAVLISRVKEMKCGSKTIPQEYIDCFNDYIEKVINTRVDEEIAVNFEAGKFKTAKDLVYAYKNLEKVFTKSRQKIAELELKLAESVEIINEWMQLNIEKSTEINQLKQQLAEKDAEVQSWKDGTMVVKLGKLEEQLAEKEKECAVWKRAYEYAIFECDFYKNHTQTTNEETMKRIEQLYEKILKRAKSLMEDK